MRCVNPGALAFELPYDVTVEDPRLGFSYCNDPWWPEVGALLRDRYDWPRTDLSPLGKLALADDKALDKKPPPPFQFASWIRPRAPRLAGETVKVVLLVFDDGTSETRRSLAPALKRLDETYRPAGLEIIVVEPPRIDVEFMKQAVESYDINYAVCVDAPGSGRRRPDRLRLRGRTGFPRPSSSTPRVKSTPARDSSSTKLCCPS